MKASKITVDISESKEKKIFIFIRNSDYGTSTQDKEYEWSSLGYEADKVMEIFREISKLIKFINEQDATTG